MSFRSPYITQYIYLADGTLESRKKLRTIRNILKKYSRSFAFEGGWMRGYGYFHGYITGLYPGEESVGFTEMKKELKKLGVRVKIVYE